VAGESARNSFCRLQRASPLTTPPYSNGFLTLRYLRYARCVIQMESGTVVKASLSYSRHRWANARGRESGQRESQLGDSESVREQVAASRSSMISAAMLQSLLLLRFRRLSCSPNDSTPQPRNVSTSRLSVSAFLSRRTFSEGGSAFSDVDNKR
jgi:hypothetical protein